VAVVKIFLEGGTFMAKLITCLFVSMFLFGTLQAAEQKFDAKSFAKSMQGKTAKVQKDLLFANKAQLDSYVAGHQKELDAFMSKKNLKLVYKGEKSEFNQPLAYSWLNDLFKGCCDKYGWGMQSVHDCAMAMVLLESFLW